MGNKNSTTTLINHTDKIMEIREFRGTRMGENDIISKITMEAGKQTDIDSAKYGGRDSQGGLLPCLKIFCNGSFLRSSGGDLVLPGDKFINFKTVTIEPAAEGQNSTGVVNYKIKFEPRNDSLKVYQVIHSYDAQVPNEVSPAMVGGSMTETPHAGILQVSRDLVLLDHDNGWSVHHFENGSVKLTLMEGMTMTLDPSKLFDRNIVKDPETVLLRMVLQFWPRTFADLKCKEDLGRTIHVVNDLMRQAKLYNVDRLKVKHAKVVENVRVLNDLRAAKVEWYRPLFPGVFPPVVETMPEVDKEKLKKFATTIEPLLRQPNSLLGRSS